MQNDPAPATSHQSFGTPHYIYVLTTGGTMEKVYSESSGSVANTENKIDRYLRLLRLPDVELNIVSVMNKDSLEMTEQDRVRSGDPQRKRAHGDHAWYGHNGRDGLVPATSASQPHDTHRPYWRDDSVGF
jgi:hypothetical protein